jgi:hypothetical protein
VFSKVLNAVAEFLWLVRQSMTDEIQCINSMRL